MSSQRDAFHLMAAGAAPSRDKIDAKHGLAVEAKMSRGDMDQLLTMGALGSGYDPRAPSPVIEDIRRSALRASRKAAAMQTARRLKELQIAAGAADDPSWIHRLLCALRVKARFGNYDPATCDWASHGTGADPREAEDSLHPWGA